MVTGRKRERRESGTAVLGVTRASRAGRSGSGAGPHLGLRAEGEVALSGLQQGVADVVKLAAVFHTASRRLTAET